MALLVLEQLVQEVLDSRREGLVVVLPVAVDESLSVLEGGLVAVEGDLLDVLAEVRKVVVAVDLEKLDELLFLEGGND